MIANDVNEQERSQYLLMLNKQITALKELIELGEKHTRLFTTEINSALFKKKKECEKLYRKLEYNEFEIAIVGLEKAGKSTFANALIQAKILPDADERCTYTSTCLKYGRNDEAIVRFFTTSEFDERLRGYLRSMRIPNADQYSINTLTKSQYNALYNKLGDESKSSYANNVHKDILNILEHKESLLNQYLGHKDISIQGEEELKSQNFKKFIVDPGVAIAVKEVTINSPKLSEMQNAIIYDVPGFDSPTKMHAEQTEERMKQADAIVLIASAAKPSFTGPCLDMFDKVVDGDNVGLREKLFVFGNRADSANTLKKNINTLRDEINRYNMMDYQNISERLLVGSARARLQSLGLEEGTNSINGLNEGECKDILKGNDGIEAIYQKLVEYNNTERFGILKKKVKKNNDDIKKIFQDLKASCQKETNIYDVVNNTQGRLGDYIAAKTKALQEILETYREEIRDEYNRNKVLTHNLQEQIKDLFASYSFEISDEDVQKAKRKIGETASSTNVSKVENAIRENKFYEIYAKLEEIVVNIAIVDHEKHFNELVKQFATALEVGADEKALELITDYVGNFNHNSGNTEIYRALVERFIRDIVEVLIMRPYGDQARLQRFLDDSRTLTGLIVFYDGSATSGVSYQKSLLSVAPKDQPLLYAMLFHEYQDAIEQSNGIMEILTKLSPKAVNDERILQTVFKLIRKAPFTALQLVKNTFVKFNPFNRYNPVFSSIKDVKAEDILASLKDILSNIGEDEEESKIPQYDFTDDRFSEEYQKHFVSKELREYEFIKTEFAVDVKVLCNLLVSASAYAISLEKPFVAKEVGAIAKLLASLDNGVFRHFINDNSNIFGKEYSDELERALIEWEINMSVIHNIDEVLATLAS